MYIRMCHYVGTSAFVEFVALFILTIALRRNRLNSELELKLQ